MAKGDGYRKLSRVEFLQGEDGATMGEVRLGCLQRIADGVELMGKNFAQMERDVKYWRERAERAEASVKVVHRSRSALLGQITKLRKRAAGGGEP